MKKLELTDDMREAIKRCVWFEKPEEIVKDPIRLTAYFLTHGMPEDVQVLRAQLNNSHIMEALDNAPPGIYDTRSWAYWNLIVGRYQTPPLPQRSLS